MKHKYFFRLFFSFVTLSVVEVSAQTDTNYIKAFIDSCKGLNTSEQKITCGNELLKLVRLDIGVAKNQKEKICLSIAEADAFRNMGNAYRDMGMTSKAMEYYQKSKEKADKINYKSGIARALLNSGIIYQEIAKDTADYNKALHFLEQGLKIFKEINDKKGIGFCWSSLGVTYDHLHNYKFALEKFQKSVNVFEEIQDKNNIANNLRNIGSAYEGLFDYESALENYKKSLSIYEVLGDSSEIGLSLAGIGNIYQLKGNLKKADEYYSRVLQISKKTQNLSTEAEALKAIKDIYRKQGKYKEALDINDNYMAVNDSNVQLQKVEDIAKMEMQSDFTKKEATTKVEHEKQIAIEEERQSKLRVIIASVIGGLFLVLIFSIFILNRWRITQKQKKIIEVQKVEVEKQKEIVDEQKKIVEEKNKDITDSINYASRIQRALLTSDEYIGRYLKEYFILFKPKDIVSGDFYWAFSPLSSGRGDGGEVFYFACCDCTGHGVPGAFMSLLNISFLNEALIEKELRDTDKILNDVRSNVIKALNPDGKGEGKDGMDSVFCQIDFKNNILHASCANNPIWILRNSPLSFGEGKGVRLDEIAPDKMPVGLHSTMDSFKNNSVQLNKGDIIYLFTDGYADQFGGPKGKKFKYKQLEEVILANHHLPMNEQKNILEKIYDDWKGTLEQVDDVLVIGIRV